MPLKSFQDGPGSPEPWALGLMWEQHAGLRERARKQQPLVQDSAGGQGVAPTPENMKHNKLVLQEILNDMLARGRVAADTINDTTKMFLSWYEGQKQLYRDIPIYQIKVWSYHDAWAAHKMITKLRANLGKHETMRVPWPTILLVVFLFCLRQTEQNANISSRSKCCQLDFTPLSSVHQDSELQELYDILKSSNHKRLQASVFETKLVSGEEVLMLGD